MERKDVPTLSDQRSSRTLLEAAYRELEFDRGALVAAAKVPDAHNRKEWLERGDWLALAEEVKAERIFFADRDPTVVFAELKSADDGAFQRCFNRIWCMARPQLLFLARPGELAVYDLSEAAVGRDEQFDRCRPLLATAKTLAEVQQLRARFHRELIASAAIYGEKHFGTGANRADRALIRDLKIVRGELDKLKLREGTELSRARKAEVLHGLIGRGIFIRYLEDREIITADYFEKVIELHAADRTQRKEWAEALKVPLDRPNAAASSVGLLFARVLNNKAFTYALFAQLEHDFNGDTFPVEEDEKRALLQHHLSTLRDFLLGVVNKSGQHELFFHAYDFSIIPIELISSIYEEFYNEVVGDDLNQGSHYTPPALVEFVLANTLTSEILATKPRIVDPACGSGIFLVEAFRRMVRLHCAEKENGRPNRQELRLILQRQIAGIDINAEAVRVAAFSLYLAFLHYQRPREILPDPREDLSSNPEKLRAIRLPHLKWYSDDEKAARLKVKPGAEFFDTLLAASAFDPMIGRGDERSRLAFGPNCADVVVGNPPWGNPKPRTEMEQKAVDDLSGWCDPAAGRPVGDYERSQAFIHLTLRMLKEGGRAGLLVSSGVLFKSHELSKAFRKVWLRDATLRHVVNFAHVRHVFFSATDRKTRGISPFISVVFDRTPLAKAPENQFEYWSAKRIMAIEKTGAVVINPGDRHYLNQRECLENEWLWKAYWWGAYRDEILLKRLNTYPTLQQHLESRLPGRIRVGGGYKEGDSCDSDWLENWRAYPAREFCRYGPLNPKLFYTVGARVERRGIREAYSGRRMILKEGIASGGTITARLEFGRLCFTDTGIAVRLEGLEEWEEKVVLAVYWSSLARYYFFLTLGSWGTWHDKFLERDVPGLPIRFPREAKARNRLTTIVDELQGLKSSKANRSRKRKAAQVPKAQMELVGVAEDGGELSARIEKLERELDEQVFGLYELGTEERDQVLEMCELGLDLFYKSGKSEALQRIERPGKSSGSKAGVAGAEKGLSAYLRVFLEIWNEQIKPSGEFAWRILAPASGAPLLGVLFETRATEDADEPFSQGDDEVWGEVLTAISRDSLVPAGSDRIFTDTFFRVVSEHEIMILKRDETRFWTKRAAREDAEATLLKLIVKQEALQKA